LKCAISFESPFWDCLVSLGSSEGVLRLKIKQEFNSEKSGLDSSESYSS